MSGIGQHGLSKGLGHKILRPFRGGGGVLHNALKWRMYGGGGSRVGIKTIIKKILAIKMKHGSNESDIDYIVSTQLLWQAVMYGMQLKL